MTKRFRVSGTLHTRLKTAGVDVATVLRKARLPRDLFDEPRGLLSTEELFALWDAIGNVSNDSMIGIKLGTKAKIEDLSPVNLACLSAESLRVALECMARYKKLSGPEEILNETKNEEWRVRFHWPLAVGGEPLALVDCCCAWLIAMAKHGIGRRIVPIRLEFVRLRPNSKELERHFGCRIACGATRNAVVFRLEDADAPFVTRSAELFQMLAPQFEAELKKRYPERESSFLELVRGAIQQKLTGRRPSIAEIAHDLHMSSRTLQRRLQDAGSTYHRALNEARHELARYYLSNSASDPEDTAYLLGYADSNSFARAFRAWEGSSPRMWRTRLDGNTSGSNRSYVEASIPYDNGR